MTFSEKVWIIEGREDGKKLANIAKKIKRSPPTIYTVLDKEGMMSQWTKSSSSLGRKRFRGCQYPEAETALLERFREKRAMHPVDPRFPSIARLSTGESFRFR